jgi:hypothetical protein
MAQKVNKPRPEVATPNTDVLPYVGPLVSHVASRRLEAREAMATPKLNNYRVCARARILAALLSGSVGLAGCGGGSDPNTGSLSLSLTDAPIAWRASASAAGRLTSKSEPCLPPGRRCYRIRQSP